MQRQNHWFSAVRHDAAIDMFQQRYSSEIFLIDENTEIATNWLKSLRGTAIAASSGEKPVAWVVQRGPG
ncbi:MAG: hypothetical protein AAB252_00650 [Pseudomonadota bacterium]